MRILRKIAEIGVFILQFIIAGYFLFSSSFIHAHFLAKLSSDLNTATNNSIDCPASDKTPVADQIPNSANPEKPSSKSADKTVYYQILTLAGFYLLIPIELRIIKKLLSILKRFFISIKSPPDIFQYYLFRGPPLLFS